MVKLYVPPSLYLALFLVLALAAVLITVKLWQGVKNKWFRVAVAGLWWLVTCGAIIQSGATSDLLTIDPTSKAARETPYTDQGLPVYTSGTTVASQYFIGVNIRQTAATAAGSTVFAMRNVSGTKTAYIKRIRLNQGFDGTALAASGTLRYEIVRFTTATPTGGTALTVGKKNPASGASTITDARFLDTGLTVTSVVFESANMVMALPVVSVQVAAPTTSGSTGAMAYHLFDFAETNPLIDPLILASGDGLAIRILTVATIIGSGLYGHITWEER